jgi:hypothetical protein
MISSLLSTRPSFLGGMARIADLGGVLGRRSPARFAASPAEADAMALMHDWQMVAGDFTTVLERTNHRDGGTLADGQAEE